MSNKQELLNELHTSQELLDLVVTKRRKKMLIRWGFGIIFYVSLWHLSWVRILFWIGLVMELILLAFTLSAYVKLRAKVKATQVKIAQIEGA